MQVLAVQVLDRDYFPADLALLSTTNPEGICYIETMNLDGETNLKMKKALQDTWELKHTVRVPVLLFFLSKWPCRAFIGSQPTKLVRMLCTPGIQNCPQLAVEDIAVISEERGDSSQRILQHAMMPDSFHCAEKSVRHRQCNSCTEHSLPGATPGKKSSAR